jgi:signal transduction histidine kinase
MQRKPLHEVIRSISPRIVERFVAKVWAEDLPSRPMTREEVIDSLTEYLEELAEALEKGTTKDPSSGRTAAEHGGQRWYAGYDLRALLVEYGILREAILAEIEATGMVPTAREFDGVAQFLDVGLSDGAEEFLKKTTVELERALAQAQLATEAREDVLSVVSHDLRGPLHVLYGSTKLLGEQLAAAKTPEVTRAMDRIERAVQNMDRLIGSLLDLARLKAGQMSLQLEEHSVAELIRDAVENAAPLAEARSIELKAATSAPGVVLCDRQRVLQVLANLVGNAIKFSPTGGVVTIGCRRDAGEWIFAVEDRGPGIPPDRVALIFDRFWQGGHLRSGTGLGLSIAKGLVELHRGRIWADTQVGRGSTFYFTIPGA